MTDPADPDRRNSYRLAERSTAHSGVTVHTPDPKYEVVERGSAEAALDEERARSQRYLDTAQVILLALDVNGRITMVNRYACSVLGWTAAELLGRDFIETCVPARIRDETRAKLGSVLCGPDVSVVDNVILTSSGEERMVEWRTTLLRDAQGQVMSTLSSGTDLTDRRILEQQFQQAQKMDAIGRLAGGVAHDFNNLLTVILGHCELLLADFDAGDARQHNIMEIQKAGTSAAGLTRQLLAFSRKQIIEPTLLDLNEVLTGMRTMVERLIGEDVRIVLRLQHGLGPVMVDRGQIEQIVINLAVNARDAMAGGGTLTIETANVELDADYPKTHLAANPGPYVVLTVSDSGTGLTAEVKERLFEPFFTTKDVGKGTGLGLSTVHGIVQRAGGSINVYSELGLGTSFKVYFPRQDATATAAQLPPPAAWMHSGMRTVLIVEDADGLRALSRRMLERQGFAVLVAANGDEALEQFERNPSIDVLLTDVVMPGISGPELTRRLEERCPALKVVYMSGYTEETIVHHGVLRPGIAFLHKPFTSEALGRKIHEVLDR